MHKAILIVIYLSSKKEFVPVRNHFVADTENQFHKKAKYVWKSSFFVSLQIFFGTFIPNWRNTFCRNIVMWNGWKLKPQMILPVQMVTAWATWREAILFVTSFFERATFISAIRWMVFRKIYATGMEKITVAIFYTQKFRFTISSRVP